MRAAAWHSRARRRYSSALVRVTAVARWYAIRPTGQPVIGSHKEAPRQGRPSRGLRGRTGHREPASRKSEDSTNRSPRPCS
jgi:hypothetical protein